MAIVEGTSGNDRISATRTVPGQPFATNLDDTLFGYAGDDRLDGAAGADVMTGGLGNDWYAVDNVGDQVIELAGEGIDTVYTSLSIFELGANVEGLKFIGSGNFSGTGNDLANKLRGGSGADTLYGGDGDDRLYARAGADLMFGGLGNDHYYVGDSGDQVIEAADEGIDTIYTTLSSFDLGTNVENLRFIGSGNFVGTGNELANRLVGGAGADTLVAGASNDQLDGRAGADEIHGGLGNDRLDGGAGADVMFGGLGNDRYYVDRGDDAVFEVAGEGIDTIYASADYALIPGQSIEHLRVAGTAGLSLAGNELANSLRGGVGDDTLNGGEGNDRIDGGGGADLMAGGLGDDIYYVDNPSDIVFEDVGEGIDKVYASTDYALTAGYEVEIMRVLGSDGLWLAGNEFGNTLYGGAGDDLLEGGEGDDRLLGSAGIDFLDGGEGDDHLEGGTGDDILDGGSGADRLEGRAGDDTLVDCECDFDDVLMGGGGDDFLLSGGGADQLSGGDGIDVFVYLESTDSTHDRRDTILDFEHGDILDFSSLADGNIFYNGFVSVATAPVMIDAYTILAFVTGSDTILYLNNTDTAQLADMASMEILMLGMTTLTASDLGFYVT